MSSEEKKSLKLPIDEFSDFITSILGDRVVVIQVTSSITDVIIHFPEVQVRTSAKMLLYNLQDLYVKFSIESSGVNLFLKIENLVVARSCLNSAEVNVLRSYFNTPAIRGSLTKNALDVLDNVPIEEHKKLKAYKEINIRAKNCCYNSFGAHPHGGEIGHFGYPCFGDGPLSDYDEEIEIHDGKELQKIRIMTFLAELKAFLCSCNQASLLKPMPGVDRYSRITKEGFDNINERLSQSKVEKISEYLLSKLNIRDLQRCINISTRRGRIQISEVKILFEQLIGSILLKSKFSHYCAIHLDGIDNTPNTKYAVKRKVDNPNEKEEYFAKMLEEALEPIEVDKTYHIPITITNKEDVSPFELSRVKVPEKIRKNVLSKVREKLERNSARRQKNTA